MPVATPPAAPKSSQSKLLSSPLLEPRIWIGMSMPAWWRMLATNGFQINWKLWPVALGISLYGPGMSTWGALARLWDARKMRQVKIDQAPLFILGHWRSGTTLLHELMVLDERHAFPSTYACFAPGQFLHSQWFAERYLNFLLPEKRPMDRMSTGWAKPQEEEFALCNMGIPSPYRTIAFPNCPPQCQQYLTMEGLSPAEIENWKQGLEWFLKQVTIASPGKRLVLKSPTHTGRVKTLLEMFPDARFVHIVRDPSVVFPSTVHLWKTLYKKHGLQTPRYEGLEEYVLSTFTQMYDALERDRELVPEGRFAEVRYEDLVGDPIPQMRLIYDRLELGGFDELLPHLESYFAANRDYQTNRYELSDQQREAIHTRWHTFIEQYGYDAS